MSDNCKSLIPSYRIFVVQYYLPPEENVTKDFLRQIFTEEKKLMKMSDIIAINVPLY